ncbi:PDZ domain-containing protein [Collinsella sp. BA40]|uniref:M50 family metallopeptidase n=1 Tax=Collinsella sp. BA40 TaxID=2560852 RepID=UPI0011C8FFC5|nr:site-2 protease family protein [Collinsella sp. BA40]TXF36678.1 PDZ domain-containing protein [Collinsella sp. BA40]
MDAIFGFITPLFWGVLLLSLLVFVHEGGHFLAARACGVRVTEFFLGLPFRYNISHTSKRIGTKFGVTPLLLGGYAAICGMDPEQAPHAARVLSRVHEAGAISVDELAEQLEITPDEALEACVFLMGWGSVLPVYDASKGEGPTSKYYPSRYMAPARDAAGNTVFDGRVFDRAGATSDGEPWTPPMGAERFFELERSHTYVGKGFFKRAFMLLAGILVNLVTGVTLFVIAYSAIGYNAPIDVNIVGSITEGSPAAAAHIQEGDRILAVDGTAVDSWSELLAALGNRDAGATVALEVWSPSQEESAEQRLGPVDRTYLEAHGSTHTVEAKLDEDGLLGIGVLYHTMRVSPMVAARMSVDYLVQTAQGVAKLLMPQHTKEVLDSSTSVVGISVLSAQAAEQGAASFMSFAALISFSLGFMNLLPIPPLDGGKLVIEAIQAVRGKELSVKAQTIVSYVGIAFFAFLFLYMLRADILRLLH